VWCVQFANLSNNPYAIKYTRFLFLTFFNCTCGINFHSNKNTFSVSCKEKLQRDICYFCPNFKENQKISTDFGKSLKYEISRQFFIWVSCQVSSVMRRRLIKRKLYQVSCNEQRTTGCGRKNAPIWEGHSFRWKARTLVRSTSSNSSVRAVFNVYHGVVRRTSSLYC